MPIPFQGNQFTFTQPDGTTLEVKGWGDQYSARFETLAGDPVVLNPATGFYELASLTGPEPSALPSGLMPGIDDPVGLREENAISLAAAIRPPSLTQPGLPRTATRWQVRLGRKKRERMASAAMTMVAPAPPQRTTTGTYVGLCILVDFPDVPGTITKAQVEAFCNKPGYSEFGNSGSVHDYYKDVSGGRLDYTNIVTTYYTAKKKRAYYTDNTIRYPVRAQELITEAIKDLKAKHFDFSALTTDDEHYVYAINVFYAGKCVNNWSEGLWPHSSSLPSPIPLGPNMLAYDYQFTNMDSELALATFCHENGHMVCDFPDLYDYDSAAQGVGAGDGFYCLMCYGGNASPKNPGQVCAYLKYRAGWADSVTTLTNGLHATIHAGKNEFFVHAKNPSEYFLIENRQAVGRDKVLGSSGLVIWHVDETGNNSYEQMTPTRHYECSLEQADGKFHLERNQNQGDGADFFKAGNKFSGATTPNSLWWDGTPSGLTIQSVSAAGPTMTFTAKL